MMCQAGQNCNPCLEKELTFNNNIVRLAVGPQVRVAGFRLRK